MDVRVLVTCKEWKSKPKPTFMICLVSKPKLTSELWSEHVIIVFQETVQQFGDVESGDSSIGERLCGIERHGLNS